MYNGKANILKPTNFFLFVACFRLVFLVVLLQHLCSHGEALSVIVDGFPTTTTTSNYVLGAAASLTTPTTARQPMVYTDTHDGRRKSTPALTKVEPIRLRNPVSNNNEAWGQRQPLDYS